MDTNSCAARDFYREVREFAEGAKSWDPTAFYYDTQPDEVWDLTLVSDRVYGRRDEVLAIMAAAGIDTVDQPLTQRRLILPKDYVLSIIKRRVGFESRAELRGEDGVPTWLGW